MTRRRIITFGLAALVGASLLFGGAPVVAQALEALLPELLGGHDRIIARKADQRAARNRAREALGDWFPTLDTTVNYGYENIETPHSTDDSLPFQEVDLSLTQKLWDFGVTNAAVENARLDLAESEIKLLDARHDLIQEAVEAYVNLSRANKVLAFARRSKDNIQKQTGLEQARVETGSGLSTDVLQAKSQLAGAEAREIQSEGTLISARNRYRAVFNSAADLARLAPVRLPVERLPKTLDSALTLALQGNADLKIERIAAAKARQDVHSEFGGNFFPSIDGTVERKWKNNISGVRDLKKEFLAKVEMTMPFNLGMTAINTLRAAQSDLVSQVRTVADTRRTIEEEVRNAWQELHTAQATSASLQNQSDISSAFLALAREERKIGQRSLIDVLSGETSLINSQSDAESAQADVLIAAYKLLNVTGNLDMGVFDVNRSVPITPPATSQSKPEPTSKPANEAIAKTPAAKTVFEPLGKNKPEPGEVTDDELHGGLSKEAARPFNLFIDRVRTIFDEELERNKN